MNLQQNLRYPLTKFLAEELTGRFYESELSCINRMLILYYNRVSFAIDGSEKNFLNEYEAYLSEPIAFWWLSARRLHRMNTLRRRMLMVLSLQRDIFTDLLAKTDFLSLSRKIEAIRRIRDWLSRDSGTSVFKPELVTWRDSLDAQYRHLFETMPAKATPRNQVIEFYQVLTGRDDAQRKSKFARLIVLLQKEGWLGGQTQDGRYRFRNRGKGSRLQIAALYYTLSARGHIEQRLAAPFIAGLFNKWLDHGLAEKSFEKIFQTEQQQTFNCSSSQPRFRYVKECELLISGL
ncbi:hypothetical protein SAMN05216327_11256 [Dyadobacter sp. SG02]|uniref:hypothetical protein n=1 Tax=Dyadobacter sp. SG02 TaxID=1855291 RepID=UPI0008B7728D|nr:hypothetical protein [Dyadobacter sp. SG02]SEJ53162.1 hypothetical protein SAMN05216327_11256 [Dyadobacter sp. SG02]